MRWMSLIRGAFSALGPRAAAGLLGSFTGENRQNITQQSFAWGCSVGVESGVIFTSLLLHYFTSYCGSCHPLVPFPGKRFFSMAKPVGSHQVASDLSPAIQASGDAKKKKKPNRKPERDHMDGVLKTPLNKCLWQREFSKCALLFQVPREEACLIDWGHSWLYWKMGEWISKTSFKQTKQEKSKTHLLGTKSNGICFDPLFAQWVDILISLISITVASTCCPFHFFCWIFCSKYCNSRRIAWKCEVCSWFN